MALRLRQHGRAPGIGGAGGLGAPLQLSVTLSTRGASDCPARRPPQQPRCPDRVAGGRASRAHSAARAARAVNTIRGGQVTRAAAEGRESRRRQIRATGRKNLHRQTSSPRSRSSGLQIQRCTANRIRRSSPPRRRVQHFRAARSRVQRVQASVSRTDGGNGRCRHLAACSRPRRAHTRRRRSSPPARTVPGQ